MLVLVVVVLGRRRCASGKRSAPNSLLSLNALDAYSPAAILRRRPERAASQLTARNLSRKVSTSKQNVIRPAANMFLG